MFLFWQNFKYVVGVDGKCPLFRKHVMVWVRILLLLFAVIFARRYNESSTAVAGYYIHIHV